MKPSGMSELQKRAQLSMFASGVLKKRALWIHLSVAQVHFIAVTSG